uniref:Uncharacterized protein n=1 Tax=viral metagenome TaxID=1070528 RepID=A0A6M3L8F4_9ZZZZ
MTAINSLIMAAKVLEGCDRGCTGASLDEAVALLDRAMANLHGPDRVRVMDAIGSLFGRTASNFLAQRREIIEIIKSVAAGLPFRGTSANL